jgi:hypothetical protein
MTASLRLIPLRPRQRLGPLQCLLAGEDIRSQSPALQIIEVKEFGFPAIRKADLIAAAIRHRAVPDDRGIIAL